ncbi:envelope stress response membrane protein PspB [Sphingomonas sp.]|uniref:envelope stress response membrane protein PspB n=1 Tax=Sphingomonas sp. TaxID=28214 RepID=UPI001ECCD77F|nr:envelope stress response membrane protein PspB [Sphingomonas sp.]MBX3592830.1 envelope stress response membrane protein PspB [Sphingomonas sp.]
MLDFFLPVVIVGMLFIGMPWVILHYVTKWKQAKTLTGEDENLLDELHYTARRLEDRLHTIERIIAADNPEFRLRSHEAPAPRELPDYDLSRRN